MTAPIKLAVFNTHPYDKKFLSAAHASVHGSSSTVELAFHDFPLSKDTVSLVTGAKAVCVFVNDDVSSPVVEALHEAGVRAILLRCAGFNNVDLEKAKELGMFVANVPSYSPEAVAEFALALIQTLNRNTHRAYNRVREGNYNLDGLLGKTLHGKAVGIIGTGKIGVALARILKGFGCTLLAHDPYESDAFKELGKYTDLETLLSSSDIVSLHCPLMPSTRYIINADTLPKMKKGAMLVNTSRGALIDTKAVIKALKSKQLGGLALDVYEGESKIFYKDHSGSIIDDDVLSRLTTFHNVIVCGHQAFFTEEALTEISEVTLRNLDDFVEGRPCANTLIKDQPPTSGLFPVRTI
ncbi:D-isomer specific 2-hydroxyacid dehydrogenase [Diaporthe helianthi]|uniref:D-isomer specific 2-hydroxyacid dehydrogenase n=1 Tax=Diaporthe helianthi TaxID=158607 RepID=A0A2P5HW41_DIAHE|nr:D-isomer specific 2-hydroxyacid dehydrogenase [Diaporthe helianthi]